MKAFLICLGLFASVSSFAAPRRFLVCLDPVNRQCRYDCGLYEGALCAPLTSACQTEIVPKLAAGEYGRDALGAPGNFQARFENYAAMSCWMKFTR